MFHEELTLQWIVIEPRIKPTVFKHAWFFFEMLVSVVAMVTILDCPTPLIIVHVVNVAPSDDSSQTESMNP